jgi:uncharacterized protein YprB with RNaseH-like and TPR domain
VAAGGLLELPGAELLDVAGARVFTVRRAVRDLLPGAEVAAQLFSSLRRLPRRDPERLDHGLHPAVGAELHDVVVMDLETTGFWGCPVFLVGLLFQEGGELVTRQLLARDYAEEALILRAAAELLASRKLLITFNGKSYDVPCLRERSVVHRVADRIRRLAHVDVLHPARRRYRGKFSDCRLQTLERSVLGITRTGDIPSAEIPAAYHDFVATRDGEALGPILHHGRIDLLTTIGLFVDLARSEAPRNGLRPARVARSAGEERGAFRR